MTASLDWHDKEKSILILRLEGEYDIETIAVLEGQLPMMVSEQPHHVDVIIYLCPGAKLPPLQGILPEMGILINVMPPNFGCIVNVGNGFLLTNPVSLWFASMLLAYYYKENKSRIHVAASVDRAVQFIQHMHLTQK